MEAVQKSWLNITVKDLYTKVGVVRFLPYTLSDFYDKYFQKRNIDVYRNEVAKNTQLKFVFPKIEASRLILRLWLKIAVEELLKVGDTKSLPYNLPAYFDEPLKKRGVVVYRNDEGKNTITELKRIQSEKEAFVKSLFRKNNI